MDDDLDSDERRRTAADYDALPYPSFPYGYLHPGRLAALAVLHGLAPAPVATGRVLELGCASGGNLIPLAAQFPQARFVGVDLSPRQVADGQRRITQLGLSNITLLAGDLAQLQLDGEPFDTILCHGVYSWVPASVQAAILRLCQAHLAPAGVAAISYNVLPGWHLRSVVRDICLAHAGRDGPPLERAARARAGLIETASALRDPGPYSAVLRSEVQRIAESPSSYILGEFLAENNTAFAFDEFAGQVAAHGLGYLCEGSFATSQPETFMPSAAARIRALAGDDAVAVQRHTDLVSGRRFRRSLVVRADAAAAASVPEASRLRTLHFASTLTEDAAAAGAGSRSFVDGKGRRITLKDRAVAAAFALFAPRFPATASFDELVQAAGPNPSPATAARVAAALLRLLGTGRATVSTTPLVLGRPDAPRPLVWPLARLEASSGQPWVTGRHHVGVPPPPAVRWLMPHMDGSRDRDALLGLLQPALERGTLGGGTEAAGAPAEAGAVLDASLAFLARQALLDDR